MRTRLKLQPGQRGTKKLLAEHGERLVCVRYRYDLARKRRYKTIELIVDERVWEPRGFLAEDIVFLRAERFDTQLLQRIKRAGGRWRPTPRVWELRYDQALRHKLKQHIVGARLRQPR